MASDLYPQLGVCVSRLRKNYTSEKERRAISADLRLGKKPLSATTRALPFVRKIVSPARIKGKIRAFSLLLSSREREREVEKVKKERERFSEGFCPDAVGFQCVEVYACLCKGAFQARTPSLFPSLMSFSEEREAEKVACIIFP